MQTIMRYRFVLAERNLSSSLILADIFSQLDSWRFPHEGPDSKNYHIEFHMSENTAKEFFLQDSRSLTVLRREMKIVYGIRKDIVIKFYLIGQEQPFTIHKGIER